jgi:hypothetical protein
MRSCRRAVNSVLPVADIRLASASEDVLAGALRTAWKLRNEKNARPGQKKRPAAEGVRGAKKNTRKKR